MNTPAPIPTTDAAALYAGYDHMDPPIGPDGTPYQYYEAFRDAVIAGHAPVGWSEKHGGFWVVTRAADVEAILRAPESFSSAGVIFPKYGVTEPLMLAEQDEPEHMRGRRLVNMSFMPKSVAQFDDQIEKSVHDLIDGFIERGATDLGRIIADPIPSIVTALLLGFPPEYGPKFDMWTSAATKEYLTDREAALPKIAEMYEYFEANIKRRRECPGTDILSQVINSKVDGQQLSHTELLGFSTVLLIGGIENSAKLIGSAMWRLGWDMELRRRLVDHPALMTTAVDEFLRYYCPATVGRIVTKDTRLHGCTLRTGQQVMLALPIANRDPERFPNPDAFLPDRPRNSHLSLGSGLHVCLGQHLIRMEARLVLNALLARIPDFRPDPSRPSRWISGVVAGMARVPVTFKPDKPRGTTRAPGVQEWLAYAERP
ncbi:MAG: cytochrome P450 [Pirellulaceae bacterium]